MGEETQGTPHETDPGAFLPVNDDYDEDALYPDIQTPLASLYDNDFLGAELYLDAPAPVTGTWKLTFPAELNVYQVLTEPGSRARSLSKMSSGAERSVSTGGPLGGFYAGFMVEGAAASTGVGSTQLRATFRPSYGDTSIEDAAALTSYKINGVEWEAIDSPLEADPGGGAACGVRRADVPRRPVL